MAIQMQKGDAYCFCERDQLDVLQKAGWTRKTAGEVQEPAKASKPRRAAKASKAEK